MSGVMAVEEGWGEEGEEEEEEKEEECLEEEEEEGMETVPVKVVEEETRRVWEGGEDTD